MPQHLRTGIEGLDRIAGRKRVYAEALNPHFGYFYTVKKTLKKAKTKFQDIELIDTDEFGKVMLLDSITQVAEKNEHQYHEPMVHPAMCNHPKAQDILVIGGGDGGIIREVLKYPKVKRVELAELDQGVIDFSKKYLQCISQQAFDDSRLNINITDGRRFTQEHAGEFDIVLMDMTDPFGPSKMLYTKEFFKEVKKSFKDENGFFVMHSESPISRPHAFSCIQKTLRSTFKYVNTFYIYIQMYAVLWSISIGSDTIDLSALKEQEIDKKLKKVGLQNLKVYNGATHVAMQVMYPYITEILRKPSRIITDRDPDFPDNFID